MLSQIQRPEYGQADLQRAVREARLLLLDHSPQNASGDDMHRAKSVLYVAIEKLGIRINRIHEQQRLLRELLCIITTQGDKRSYERDVGLQILNELEGKIKRRKYE